MALALNTAEQELDGLGRPSAPRVSSAVSLGLTQGVTISVSLQIGTSMCDVSLAAGNIETNVVPMEC